MLSILKQQQNRLKNLFLRRIDEDFEEYTVPVMINRILREEEDGVDIEWKYGKTFERIYRMMVEVYGVINVSVGPYEDPIVHTTLAKYDYYISPSGRHIYGAGPKEKFR